MDLSPSIRVNAVESGQVAVECNESIAETQSDEVANTYPLERIGNPEDIALVVAFLASDAAKFVAGVTVPADRSLHGRQAAYRDQP